MPFLFYGSVSHGYMSLVQGVIGFLSNITVKSKFGYLRCCSFKFLENFILVKVVTLVHKICKRFCLLS